VCLTPIDATLELWWAERTPEGWVRRRSALLGRGVVQLGLAPEVWRGACLGVRCPRDCRPRVDGDLGGIARTFIPLMWEGQRVAELRTDPLEVLADHDADPRSTIGAPRTLYMAAVAEAARVSFPACFRI
jgi:hypothetical protein